MITPMPALRFGSRGYFNEAAQLLTAAAKQGEETEASDDAASADAGERHCGEQRE
jgi:hypothetical protein